VDYILCRNRVTDLEKWKKAFDADAATHREAGLKLMHLWQGSNEPDNVFFFFETTNLTKARAYLTSLELAVSWEGNSVIEGETFFIESKD